MVDTSTGVRAIVTAIEKLRAKAYVPHWPGRLRDADEAVPELELPTGSALLVVKPGPNSGALFLLDRDFTTAAATPTAISSSTTYRQRSPRRVSA